MKYRKRKTILMASLLAAGSFLLTQNLIGEEKNLDDYLNSPPVTTSESLKQEQDNLYLESGDNNYDVAPNSQAVPYNKVSTKQPQNSATSATSQPQKNYQSQVVIVEDTPISEDDRRRSRVNKILQRAQEGTNNEAINQINLQRLKKEGELRNAVKSTFKKKKKQSTAPQYLSNEQNNQYDNQYNKQLQKSQRDSVINSIQEEISTISDKISKKDSRSYSKYLRSKHYVGGLFNFYTSYPTARNVDFRWSGGATVGLALDDPGFIVEASFLYSNYYLDDIQRAFTEVKQYNTELFLKYSIFPEKRVRPYGGAGLAYVVRKYHDINRPFSGRSASSKAYVSSNAVDMAVVGGVDMLIHRRLSLGLEYRYYYNINYESDSDSAIGTSRGYNYNTLEKQSYSLIAVILRLNF